MASVGEGARVRDLLGGAAGDGGSGEGEGDDHARHATGTRYQRNLAALLLVCSLCSYGLWGLLLACDFRACCTTE